jgi:hypothetical protein
MCRMLESPRRCNLVRLFRNPLFFFSFLLCAFVGAVVVVLTPTPRKFYACLLLLCYFYSGRLIYISCKVFPTSFPGFECEISS